MRLLIACHFADIVSVPVLKSTTLFRLCYTTQIIILSIRISALVDTDDHITKKSMVFGLVVCAVVV